MRKIAINSTFGGYGLTDEVIARYESITGKTNVDDLDIERDDPHLIAIIEELGVNRAGTDSLKIVEIPSDVEWHIHDYDGWESVHENHRTWS